jgi:hypothetical protein
MNVPKTAGLTALVLAVGFFSAACDESRDVQTETRTIAREGAERAEVDVRMGAGELRLEGADQEALMEATFRYNRERLKPEVDYQVAGTTGILRVERRRHSGVSFGHVHNEWDLRLAKALPVELKVKLGAGQSRLDLRGLDLTGLDIDMGVGEMRLDLSGPRSKSFRVDVNGGIGSGTLYLPADVGVRVKVDGGLGSVDTRGLSKSGGVYTNEAYGRSAVSIDVRIDAGIGSLDLRVVPGDSARL